MKINQTNILPTTGQFVAIWIHEDQIWSDTYKWVGKELWVYPDPEADDFIQTDLKCMPWTSPNSQAQFFVIST